MARLRLIEINDTNVSFVEKNIPLCELEAEAECIQHANARPQ
jgi:hypothetical protein